MDAMTSGFSSVCAEDVSIAKWSVKALRSINRSGGQPDFIVGRPEAVIAVLEDEGRTLVLPLPQKSPKVYASINETGGVTLMLADEY